MSARQHRLSTVLNDWTSRTVDSFDGLVKVRTLTPEGQHVTLTLSDAQARQVGHDLLAMAEGAALCRSPEERYDLACGCDVRDLDASNGDHRLSCPIRGTFE